MPILHLFLEQTWKRCGAQVNLVLAQWPSASRQDRVKIWGTTNERRDTPKEVGERGELGGL